jgi:hypothetical protein
MPAKSEKQRKFFGAVMGAKKGKKGASGKAKKVAKEMPKKKIKKFLTKEAFDDKKEFFEIYVKSTDGPLTVHERGFNNEIGFLDEKEAINTAIKKKKLYPNMDFVVRAIDQRRNVRLVFDTSKNLQESKNHLGEREFATYGAWKAACKKIKPNVVFDGDKDICEAKGVGSWDGEKGSIYKKKIKESFNLQKTMFSILKEAFDDFDDVSLPKFTSDGDAEMITQDIPEIVDETGGQYPEVTIQMDSMGNLHVWNGFVDVEKLGKYLYHGDGREADKYFQFDHDIKSFTDHLPIEDKRELEKGYAVVTKHIPDDYFLE